MNFKNLAGHNRPIEENDKQIKAELTRAGIPVLQFDSGIFEVRTTVCGKLILTDFVGALEDVCSNKVALPRGWCGTFTRAWTYWMVSCRVPLEMAKRIYEHPVGRTDIRVGGHCGCVAPEYPFVEWRCPMNGRKYATMKDREDIEKFKENHPEMYTKFLLEHEFHDDPETVGARGTVDSYHIDSELGLYVFVQFLRGQL